MPKRRSAKKKPREGGEATLPSGTLAEARESAMRALSFRQRSTRELEKRLEEKGFTPDVICSTTGWLTGLGYLNDEAFAADYAASRTGNRNWGRIKIAAGLRAKGIDAELIERAIGGIGEEEELRAARAALDKWLARRRAPSPLTPEAAHKAKMFLKSRGFAFSLILAAMKLQEIDQSSYPD